ncbi:hypothetical protein PENSPDRAFT_611228 [Peniophora sp. CONT]|nr:hypothetical protein PENSPDRAFT_611228 [Peniophora sp. CONT]
MPNLLGGRPTAATYGTGGGAVSTMKSGPFKGREIGGGSRSEVYGTSVYGSGYPGRPYGSYGTVGYPFPYYYYPVVWDDSPAAGHHYPPYLAASNEYGHPTNTSRPGGVLRQATLHSNTTSTVFHFIADNSTAFAVLPIIRANCSMHGNLDNSTSSSLPFAYTGSNASDPQPVDAIQYFRASSAVLTLDGYNNTIALSSMPNATANPIPAGVDLTLLTCLNVTIGAAIPLVDAPKKHKLSGGKIAGIIVGSIAGALVLLIIIFNFRSWQRRRAAISSSMEMGNPESRPLRNVSPTEDPWTPPTPPAAAYGHTGK